MLAWFILIASFALEIVDSFYGKLKTAKYRHIVARNAMLVDAGMIALPIVL